MIDYEFVRAAVLEAAGAFDLRHVAYDRWNSSQIVQDLEGEGIEMFAMGQGFASLSAPTKELQRLVVEGKLRHGGDPLLRWCASNVAAKMDAAGNYKPDRERSAHRIDPIAALVMAVDGFQRRGHEATRRSRWENSDVELGRRMSRFLRRRRSSSRNRSRSNSEEQPRSSRYENPESVNRGTITMNIRTGEILNAPPCCDDPIRCERPEC